MSAESELQLRRNKVERISAATTIKKSTRIVISTGSDAILITLPPAQDMGEAFVSVNKGSGGGTLTVNEERAGERAMSTVTVSGADVFYSNGLWWTELT